MNPFDELIFQMSWFNHQPDDDDYFSDPNWRAKGSQEGGGWAPNQFFFSNVFFVEEAVFFWDIQEIFVHKIQAKHRCLKTTSLVNANMFFLEWVSFHVLLFRLGRKYYFGWGESAILVGDGVLIDQVSLEQWKQPGWLRHIQGSTINISQYMGPY